MGQAAPAAASTAATCSGLRYTASACLASSEVAATELRERSTALPASLQSPYPQVVLNATLSADGTALLCNTTQTLPLPDGPHAVLLSFNYQQFSGPNATAESAMNLTPLVNDTDPVLYLSHGKRPGRLRLRSSFGEVSHSCTS